MGTETTLEHYDEGVDDMKPIQEDPKKGSHMRNGRRNVVTEGRMKTTKQERKKGKHAVKNRVPSDSEEDGRKNWRPLYLFD